jgi:hypothetical protein
MTETTHDTVQSETAPKKEGLWMRVLSAIILLVLFALAETALWIFTVLQLIWLPLTGAPNAKIAELGKPLSEWIGKTVLYLTGAAEKRPFPWSDL